MELHLLNDSDGLFSIVVLVPGVPLKSEHVCRAPTEAKTKWIAFYCRT